jgi:hypothetical protein
MIQSGLVVARSMGTPKPFRDCLAARGDDLLRARRS